MRDLLIHELGARRVHWRYDDPSGLADGPGTRAARPPARIRPEAEIRLRVRRALNPEAA